MAASTDRNSRRVTEATRAHVKNVSMHIYTISNAGSVHIIIVYMIYYNMSGGVRGH